MLKQIDLSSADYPVLLRQLHKPPEQLFYQGTMPDACAPMIAIVGSRRCTDYGKMVTEQITKALSKAGLVIVSGLAFGIDAIAHQAALDVGGITIAVLGSGADRITPVDHTKLGLSIIANGGAILSQFLPGARANSFTFPIRNEVIAGMCLGTLVVEATDHSGSLITAKAATDNNREVFAVPGPINYPTSRGTNDLLKDGAHVTTSANDILDALGFKGHALKKDSGAETKEENILLPLLGKQARHIDEIIRQSKLPSSVVLTSLTMMEISGKVRHLGGNQYIIS
ncbi:MAG: DNA-processing protein DprA [Patescibacteria group bacterium]